MPLPQRVVPVVVSPVILSYYKGRDGERKPLAQLRGGRATPDLAVALLALHERCDADGGSLLITDCYRDVGVQGGARKKYERWVADGKPKPPDPKIHKAAFVARPGRSFHSAARAIDAAHMLAAPESVPRNLKLDWLWERAKPLGFTPVIKTPDEGAKEAWHFDFRGPWAHVYDHLGYAQTAMCATLDIGEGARLFARARNRWVQAQLWRAGANIGDVDGYPGKRTKAAAKRLDVDLGDEAALMRLPDAGKVLFAA